MRPLNPGDAKETHTHMRGVCVCVFDSQRTTLCLVSVYDSRVCVACWRVCVSFIHYAKLNLLAGYTLFFAPHGW